MKDEKTKDRSMQSKYNLKVMSLNTLYICVFIFCLILVENNFASSICLINVLINNLEQNDLLNFSILCTSVHITISK